jgi:GntR family transcriptional regulator
MLSFAPNPASNVPIYIQIMQHIKHAVDIGALRAGEQLPGIRPLAEQLVVNPNTVAKAYRELAHEGVIDIRHGAGAFISGASRTKRLTDKMRTAQALLHDTLAKLRARGLSDEEIRRLFEAELSGSKGVVARRA